MALSTRTWLRRRADLTLPMSCARSSSEPTQQVDRCRVRAATGMGNGRAAPTASGQASMRPGRQVTARRSTARPASSGNPQAAALRDHSPPDAGYLSLFA